MHVYHVWLCQAIPITFPQRGVRSMEIFADDRNRLSYLELWATETASGSESIENRGRFPGQPGVLLDAMVSQ
jgi:hypothetical protein